MRTILLAAIACLAWISAQSQSQAMIECFPDGTLTVAGNQSGQSEICKTSGNSIARPQHAYTLNEIDRMRMAIEIRLLDGRRKSYGGGQCYIFERVPLGGVGTFDPMACDKLDAHVEDQLRTYMQAGIGPDELEAAAHAISQQPAPTHP
jgi:hypothetical protein